MTVGGRAGVNFSNLHGSSVENNKGYIGYNIGGIFNYAMEDVLSGSFGEMFSLQGEFTLQSKGANFEVPGQDDVNQVFTYVQIPVLGKITHPLGDKIEIFGEAGFFMSALFGVTVDGEKSRDHDSNPATEKRKYREEYKGFDFGVAIGAGCMMPIPNTKLKGYLNLRYSAGLTNIGEYSDKSGWTEEELAGIKTGAFSVMVGVSYPID
jgi:hypothetical protein